jgi:hypothetical protein
MADEIDNYGSDITFSTKNDLGKTCGMVNPGIIIFISECWALVLAK